MFTGFRLRPTRASRQRTAGIIHPVETEVMRVSDPHRSTFPPPSPEDWRRATHGPKGEPPRPARWDGGIELPSVVRKADVPARATHARESWPVGGWRIGADLGLADPAAWNAAARADLADGLDVPLATLARRPGDGGLVVDGVEALELAYAGMDLASVPVFIDAGERAPEVLEWVLELARRRDVDPASLAGLVAGDPFARVALADPSFAERELVAVVNPLGTTDERSERVTAHARARAVGAADLSTLLADGTVYREAGATAVDELALALASLAEQLRESMPGHRGSPPGSSGSLEGPPHTPVLKLSAGMEVVMEVARLRAAREAAAQVLVAFGVPAARARVKVLLVPSRRAASPLDAGNHLVRSTLVALAGACGGADTIALDAPPVPTPAPDAPARRAARMAQLVLRVECGLDRVTDPTGGAHAIELLTRKLGEAAWRRFQEIEAQGGLEVALRTGWVRAHVEREAAASRERVTSRKRPIVGVSTSPDPHERGELPPQSGPLSGSAFAPVRDGEPFEWLRRARAAYAARTGAPPRALVALLGASRDYRARADWVAELLACGGLAVVNDREFASSTEAAAAAVAYPLAIATAPDARYATDVPALATAVRERNPATLLYVAGRPPDEATEAAWRAAGVHGFVHARADAFELLAGMYRALRERSDG